MRLLFRTPAIGCGIILEEYARTALLFAVQMLEQCATSRLIKPLYSRPVLPNNSCMRTTRWIGVAGIVLGGLLPGVAAVPAAEPFADSPYVVEAIPVEGLPQSSVISIVQSHEGYLWLGTLGGLARFDGTRFTDFGEADLPGLNSSRIVCLFADSRSNLWVGTEGGGILSINLQGAVTSLRSEQNSAGARLVSACEDSAGTVWLNAVNGELFRYQSNKLDAVAGRFERVAADKSGLLWVLPWGPGGSDTNLYGITAVPGSGAIVVREVVSVGKLNFLLASQSGGFWRIAEGRVQKWKAGRLERDVSDASGTYPWDPTNIVTSACEDRDGNLIIGTLGAGCSGTTPPGKPPTHISEADGSSLNYVASLCLDRDGNLWVGTDGAGLYRVRRKHFRVLQGSQKLTIQSVCEDRDGGVWFATFFTESSVIGGTVCCRSTGDADGLRDPNLRSVFVDRDHGVWVGTTIGGLFQLQSNRFQLVLGQSNSINPSVSVLHQDRAGNVWAGTQRGLAVWDGRKWKLFTTSDGLSANDVRAIAEDAQGNLWIGTELGGLNRWRDGKFTAFRKNDQGLPSDNVSALCVDSEGVLWVGTSAGLARWQQDRWTRYTTRRGTGHRRHRLFDRRRRRIVVDRFVRGADARVEEIVERNCARPEQFGGVPCLRQARWSADTRMCARFPAGGVPHLGRAALVCHHQGPGDGQSIRTQTESLPAARENRIGARRGPRTEHKRVFRQRRQRGRHAPGPGAAGDSLYQPEPRSRRALTVQILS